MKMRTLGLTVSILLAGVSMFVAVALLVSSGLITSAAQAPIPTPTPTPFNREGEVCGVPI